MLLRALALLLWLTVPAISLAEPPPLKDQYDEISSLKDFTGQPVLVIVVTTRKLRWIGRWEKSLRAKIPELDSLRVADITDEPPPEITAVSEMLRKRVPEGISIQIDMQNVWATEYQLDTSEPCLILFDAEHQVVATFRGRPKGALVNEVSNALQPYFPYTTETDPS